MLRITDETVRMKHYKSILGRRRDLRGGPEHQGSNVLTFIVRRFICITLKSELGKEGLDPELLGVISERLKVVLRPPVLTKFNCVRERGM